MVGTAVASIAGLTPDGEPVRIATDAGTRVVLAFLTSSCTTCATFWHGATDTAGGPPFMMIVTPDPTTEDRREVARRAPGSLPVVMSTDTWLRFGVRGSPFFVMLADGLIQAEGVAMSWAELVEMIPDR